MRQKKNVHEKVAHFTLSIDPRLFLKFKEHCENKGMKVSSRIRVLIEQDMKKK